MTLFLVAAAAPAAAPDPVTAQQMVDRQRGEVQTQLGLRCSRGSEDEEIVVCGRRSRDGPAGSALRIPYVPEPGRRIPGEGNFDGGGCIRLCQSQVGIDFNTRDGGKVGSIVRGIKNALDK